jgi:hypothetical protein
LQNVPVQKVVRGEYLQTFFDGELQIPSARSARNGMRAVGHALRELYIRRWRGSER